VVNIKKFDVELSILHVLVAYGIPFLLGICSAVVGHLLAAFGIRRRFRNVSVRLSDLEERFMSLKGRENVQKRWQAKDAEQEILFAAGKPGRQRFDNDPPEF